MLAAMQSADLIQPTFLKMAESVKCEIDFIITQTGCKKKQCERVYFWLHSIAYWMLIQQKLTPLELLFSAFTD